MVSATTASNDVPVPLPFSQGMRDFGQAAGIHIEAGSDSNTLRWVAPQYGVYGLAIWDPSQADWLISAGIHGKKSTSSLFLLGHPDRLSTDETKLLLLLLTFLEAGTQAPQRTGRLFQDVSDMASRHWGSRTGQPAVPRHAGSFALPDAENKFVAHLRQWIISLRTQFDCAPLITLMPEIDIFEAGGAVPFQAFGLWHHHPFYFRYRHACASLSVGGQDPVISPQWHAEAYYGEPLSGFLTTSEFMYLFAYLGERLQFAPQPHAVEFVGTDEAVREERIIYGYSDDDVLARAESIIHLAKDEVSEVGAVRIRERPIFSNPLPAAPPVPDYSRLIPENFEGEPNDKPPSYWT